MKTDPAKINDFNTFKELIGKNLGLEKYSNHYLSSSLIIKQGFEKSAFWEALEVNLEDAEIVYQIENPGYYLLTRPDDPIELEIKSFNSFIEKSFRKMKSKSSVSLDKIDEDWALKQYSLINDILRGRIVVKYLNGVEFLVDKIKKLGKQHKVIVKSSPKAEMEGYYAIHLDIEYEIEIPKFKFEMIKIKSSVEIQITTQLQEVIKKLLDKYYQERRVNLEEQNRDWQWNYKSEEFATNYLGHILHYIEGMIMGIIDKQKEQEINA